MDIPSQKELHALFSPARMTGTAHVKSGIIKAIRQGEARPHIYVYAPPDFGKTASVLTWLCDMTGYKAWISLCENDNVPNVFFTRLILAFLSIRPDNAAFTEKLRRAESDDNILLLAEEVIYYFSTGGENAYIVLDSFERITSEVLIRSLVKEVRALPMGFTVVIIGRMEPHELFSDLILRNMMSLIHKEKNILNFTRNINNKGRCSL